MDHTGTNTPIRFGTKAQTLERLKPLVRQSVVSDLYYFDVDRWSSKRDAVIQSINQQFGGAELVVRSSAFSEDSEAASMAGAFTSHLNVRGACEDSIAAAVDSVIASFGGNPHDQILVQPMLKDIAVSGVITTHVLDDGAPYYVINYDDESGKTDTITGGTGVNKTVLIHRDADTCLINSDRVARWLGLAKDLEPLCGDAPLDIEFAQTHSGECFLLQARRIAAEKNWDRSIRHRVSRAQEHIEQFITRSQPRPGVVGSYTIYGEMPDWNPAEIIGTAPRRLASSLYRYLVTDEVWSEARAFMGYRHPRNEVLMVAIGGRPFIDVRNSFNSFLPADLPEDVAAALIEAWLDRLNEHPELHDKVEFDIAHTALDFNFDQDFQQRYSGLLTPEQAARFKSCLQELTSRALDTGPEGTLAGALVDIDRLAHRQSQRQTPSAPGTELDGLLEIRSLLYECKQLGTLPFSIIARHAFIAESLLRSCVERRALTAERVAQFKRTLVSVMGDLAGDMSKVLDGTLEEGDFYQQYGHLRPGTYDILSLRYDQRDDLFADHLLPERDDVPRDFELTAAEHADLRSLLEESGFGHVDPPQLLEHAKKAIVGREYAKFVFSRNLSDAIELIAQWGLRNELSRDDLSHIPLATILDNIHNPVLEDHEDYYRGIAEDGRRALQMTHSLRLNYLIRDVRDIYVIPLHRSVPNFVTNKRIEGEVVLVDNETMHIPDLFGKIVCIENADPGFDWIFTRGIAGLLTKFGGSNSHMAIRCAEFGLPSAIGCGEQTFERLVAAGTVELNCADKVLRPIYG